MADGSRATAAPACARCATSQPKARLICMRVFKRNIPTVLVLVATLGVVSAPAAAASHRSPRKRQGQVRTLVLHPRFHRVASGVYNPLTDGRYVFLFSGEGAGGGSSVGTLIDDQTGKRRTVAQQVDPSGGNCAGGPVAMGGGSLMFDCSNLGVRLSSVRLYSLATGTSKTIAVNSQIAAYNQQCSGDSYCSALPYAVGSQWIAFSETCYHCANTSVFQNLNGGQLAGANVLQDWRPGGHTIPDLNSPGLARRVCSPVRVPSVFSPTVGGRTPGPLLFYGKSVISEGTSTETGGGNVRTEDYLERCGSRLRQRLPSGPFLGDTPYPGNSRLVITRSSARQLTGVFLPSRRAFEVVLPRSFGSARQVVVTSRSLYMINQEDQGWAAPAPTLPNRRG